jgi:hypothetical protein
VALALSNFKIFIFVVLLGMVYAQPISFCDFGSSYISSWIPITLLAILTVITILSFLYSFSRILGSYGAKLKIQLKEEFVQIAISIFLISSIVLILKPSFDLLLNVGETLGQKGDPFVQSEQYLQSLIINGISLYLEGYLYEVRFLVLGTLAANLPEWNPKLFERGGGKVFFNYAGEATSMPYASMLMTLDNILNVFILAGFASVYFLYLVVDFAEKYAFQLILPIGIISRVIPQVRRASDFFIALSIGLYIFFPALLIMNNYIFSKITPLQLEFPSSAKSIQDFLSSGTQGLSITTLGISALNIFEVFNFNQFLQKIALYDFFTFFMLGMDIALVMAFVETLANAISLGFGSLTTRIREAYAPG